MVFWVAAIAAVVITIVLLREILSPFVAGMALAYLLDAPVNRLERLGMNRAAATLFIIGGVIFGVIALIVLSRRPMPVRRSRIASSTPTSAPATCSAVRRLRPVRRTRLSVRGCADT